MSCPSQETWLAWVAGELNEVASAALLSHAAGCVQCGREQVAFGALARAAQPAAPIDSRPIVERALLDITPVAPRLRWPSVAVASALLAVGVLAGLRLAPERDAGDFWPRSAGTGATAWTSRAVAEVRPLDAVTHSLSPGHSVSSRTRFAIWYRNVESRQPLFVMAYVLDAAGELHWLSPAYLSPGSEPAPRVLPVSLTDALLDDVVELEGAATGPAQVITVISRAPGSVLKLEGSSRAVREAPETVFPDVVVWRRSVNLLPEVP